MQNSINEIQFSYFLTFKIFTLFNIANTQNLFRISQQKFKNLNELITRMPGCVHTPSKL